MTHINSRKETTVVVGLGRSGLGAAKLLKAKGEKVVVIEQSKGIHLEKSSQELRNKGIIVKFGLPMNLESFNPLLSDLKSVVVSPAIPWDNPTLNQLRSKGIKIESEISLAWETLKDIPWIGITGTNGKTTVTYMLQHVLQQNKFNSSMAGNMGFPASEIAFESLISINKKPNWIVMELSSYQLEASPEITPKIGIWTTLTPDHLDRHGSIENYSNIKKQLLEKSENRIFNFDDPYLKDNRSKFKPGIWVSSKGPGEANQQNDFWIDSNGHLFEKTKFLLDSSVLQLPGEHNLQNLLLVTAAARTLGVPGKSIEKAIASFKGVSHRLEKVGQIKGLEIFNDSKATNFDAAEKGLASMQKPSIVIAGGQLKKGNPQEWINKLKEKSLAILLFGESAESLAGVIKSSGYKGQMKCFKNLETATEDAFKIGIERNANNILFSPACSSFDQYKDYEERGDHFKKLVNKLINSF